jgi:hypothetical protein
MFKKLSVSAFALLRREWCTENCPSGFYIEPVRDAGMRLVGRRFVFASVVEAVHFKLRFDTSFR